MASIPNLTTSSFLSRSNPANFHFSLDFYVHGLLSPPCSPLHLLSFPPSVPLFLSLSQYLFFYLENMLVCFVLSLSLTCSPFSRSHARSRFRFCSLSSLLADSSSRCSCSHATPSGSLQIPFPLILSAPSSLSLRTPHALLPRAFRLSGFICVVSYLPGRVEAGNGSVD